MREILYRLKICDKWAYGLPCKIRNDTVAFDGVFADGQSVYDAFADKETLGEYTGLTDKNGNKIFEGDIVRFAEWNYGKMCWVGEIFFEYAMFQVKGNPNKECESDFIIQLSRIPSERIEIIGNIYDNLDLLEK